MPTMPSFFYRWGRARIHARRVNHEIDRDYFVFEVIKAYRPSILVCEHNSVFGAVEAISGPYDPGFRRSEAHHSNLFFGASISANMQPATSKGYTLVGGNPAGNIDLATGELRPLGTR
jgi:hypothetical protein